MACCKTLDPPHRTPYLFSNSPTISPPPFIETSANMKNSIPSEVWEGKRAEIAVLYKEEEWPLKQVIKKIRSEDFNPTETQLRSRLKKWGVTKPSRQKRKKQSDGLTTCATAKHPNRLELTTVNEPSSTQAASFPSRVGWDDPKGWIVPSGYSQHHLLKESPLLEGQSGSADWTSSNSISNNIHPPFLLHHFPTPSPLSSVHSYGHPNPTISSIADSAINQPMECHSRFTGSGTNISVSDSFVKPYPGEWSLQTSPVNTENNPMTPWSYITPDVSQSCPSHLFALGDGSAAVPDYTEYNEPTPSEDYAQQYGGSPALSPNSELELLQSNPEIKAWRRAASTHVHPNGIETTNPRVGRDPLRRRRPEVKRKRILHRQNNA
ncbi:hypothetical protein, variant 2 [Blastomyces dermatitidis ER-3]|uniref:Clr5 domain-containing protein n=1 Tax=Ajellomyces dermatitidis (strain ER-3 / ATCC MYA-2586) TaxID=559297 RepID=A0ABX2VUB0_AJEDR|nr:uncharacterized protein BDCG_03533 [Blastomyces dermatitidis ER-3]XP_045280492.1 hypothetical protein, variant 1 [Blastomyces dermatitidis ER-3]XP_045280493.1 hypothetical protein, variant 2 [Blastomyces dermatitidis ER-3]OAT00764.1 hypothetical protein BDCG_03533 [Blastomyces dermatitidis ER-3]OAT00765.1 hypothetical protein, variant 1 [Blastomyces dermatitidis ER-3]OAT00766.1 hypothetical protein, variant 2 [Blastomyces dermatitidis ER-3]